MTTRRSFLSALVAASAVSATLRAHDRASMSTVDGEPIIAAHRFGEEWLVFTKTRTLTFPCEPRMFGWHYTSFGNWRV